MSLSVSFPGRVFPLGTHVYREPHQDREELLADLPILKRLGFNMIKIQESWALDEPREGEVDLSNVERLVARAGELGLGVYLGLTMEQAPAWMWRKFPDCRLVYASGLPHNDPTQYLLPADGKPGPCWDHPGARAAAEQFIGTLVRRLGRFDAIWAWNTWQEIGFWPNEGGVLGFCYCPYTLRAFREWLATRFSSLQALNAAWRTGFGDWAEIEPPRRAAAVPITIDWRYFMDDVYLRRVLEWKTRAIRSNDPKGRPVFSHVGGPTIGSGAEWRWARAADFFGDSNYPAWGASHGWDDDHERRTEKVVSHLQEMWNVLQLRTDYCRSAAGHDRIFWGAEFQGGPISTHLHKGRDPRADDIRLWMLSGLAAGMNGISFWNHRCEIFWSECNGFGLLDPEGTSTERIEEAGRIGRAIHQDPEVFSLGKPPKADVAILVNEDLYHFCQATGNNAVGHLQYSTRGHYYRLWRMGVWVDFVEAEDVAAGALSGYKLAILPVPLALDKDWFACLRQFVEQGGTLVSDACPGRFDRYGFCPREQMVAGGEELFGARHRLVQIVREPDGKNLWTPEERGYGEFAPPTVLEGAGELAGTSLRASFYLQTLTPTTATPILMAGNDIAGTANSYGKGRAILLGTFAGHSALAHRGDRASELFARLFERAGVQPDRCGRLLRRRRLFGTKQAWFLINPTEHEVVEKVETAGFRDVRDLLGDSVIARDADSVTVKLPPASLCCLTVVRREG